VLSSSQQHAGKKFASQSILIKQTPVLLFMPRIDALFFHKESRNNSQTMLQRSLLQNLLIQHYLHLSEYHQWSDQPALDKILNLLPIRF
jgi:hypothetical protein